MAKAFETFEEYIASRSTTYTHEVVSMRETWHARDAEVAALEAEIAALREHGRLERAAALRELETVIQDKYDRLRVTSRISSTDRSALDAHDAPQENPLDDPRKRGFIR